MIVGGGSDRGSAGADGGGAGGGPAAAGGGAAGDTPGLVVPMVRGLVSGSVGSGSTIRSGVFAGAGGGPG